MSSEQRRAIASEGSLCCPRLNLPGWEARSRDFQIPRLHSQSVADDRSLLPPGELRDAITNRNVHVLSAVDGPLSPSCPVRVSARWALSCTHVRMHACASPRLAPLCPTGASLGQKSGLCSEHGPRQRRADPDSPTRPLTLASGPVSHATRSVPLNPY